MTDAEMNQLRKELPGLMTRLGVTTRKLLGIINSLRGGEPDCVRALAQEYVRIAIRDAAAAVAEWDAWLRRAAGPEDLAGFNPPDAAKREDAEVR